MARQGADSALEAFEQMNVTPIVLGIIFSVFALFVFRVVADVYVRQSPIPFVAAWLIGLLITGALGRWFPRFAQVIGSILMALFVLHLLLHISAG